VSNGFLQELVLRPPADRARQFVALVAGPLALAAVLVADSTRLPPWVPWLAVAPVCAQLLRAFFRRSPCEMTLSPGGGWQLRLPSGEAVAATLLTSRGAARGLMITLHWQAEGGGRGFSAWLLPGDVDGATWRRLRVRLLIA